MHTYKIITDSCSDLTKEQYAAYNISHASMTVLYKGEEHTNISDLAQVKNFYDSLRQGQTASTAAVNPDSWALVMEEALVKGQDVLCLVFSSGLSTTYQSAVIAAEELREKYPQRQIRVVDSLCAAPGQGLLLHHACAKRDAGYTLDQLAAWCEENKLHLCHWVTVDDLQHLKRGGRISATTAIVGGMLNIKPIIHMDDEGKLNTVAKMRGRKAALEYLANKAAQMGNGWDNETVFIGHGDCPEDAAALEALVRQKCPWVKNVVIHYIGAVIGAHTGPGVLALFFLGENRY